MSEKSPSKKVAVVLFNLGGPDSLDAVKPFLFNLFNDKYIIRLPGVFRRILAWLISTLRDKIARGIYKELGGKSPILAETEAQKQALEKQLSSQGEFKCFIAMRHWHPFAEEAIEEIIDFEPEEIICLPLYPQFSSTTTKSSVEDFKTKWCKRNKGKPDIKISTICCYPTHKKFIASHVDLLKKAIKSVQNKDSFRILFSAHGLPEDIIKDGDPYQWQVEESVKAIIEVLAIEELDFRVTYQSRVGPKKWLDPNTEDEIKLAATEKKALVVVPIAFVSEHVETLVELDIEYGEIASNMGLEYVRVPTLSVDGLFVEALSEMVTDAVGNKTAAPAAGCVVCPRKFKDCICR